MHGLVVMDACLLTLEMVSHVSEVPGIGFKLNLDLTVSQVKHNIVLL